MKSGTIITWASLVATNANRICFVALRCSVGYGKLFLILGMFFFNAHLAWAKKTVGELLQQAQQDSRGGRVENLQKAFTSLPTSQMEFADVKKQNYESIKPPPRANIFRNEEISGDQKEYEQILDQQMDELFKLTQKFKTSNNRGELWLRLAELYVEKASLIDARAQEDYTKKLALFNSGKLSAKPKLDSSQAEEYNKRAIKLYEWFERDFPRDPKISQALFFLGYNYFELGETEKGVSYYKKLNQQFPNSPFVGESHFALGEHHFENENWSQAYKEYSYLLKQRDHRLYHFALYKGAWCLYRLGETKAALNYLENLIKIAQTEGESSQASRSKLDVEAKRDLAAFYAGHGRPQNAAAYFAGVFSGEEVQNQLERLAYFYSDRGDRDSARYLFREMIKANPTAPKAFEFQYQIVQNYFFSKNSPQFKEELYIWIKDYGDDSPWAKANSSRPDLIANSTKLRETTLRNWVLQQHQTAQNSRAPFSQRQALEGYALYLREFSNHPLAADMSFFYGELLYDTGDFDQASVQYKKVVEFGPKSKFYERSGMNLVHAAERSVPPDAQLQKRLGNSLDPVPLDPKVERFIQAAKWYLDKVPTSDKAPEIKFRIGRLYYLHNQFDAANEQFKEIVRSHPKTKYSEYSANLMLDIFNLKKDYVGLEKAGGELLAVPSIADSKAGQDIRGVIEKASFKRGQDLEIARKFGESAQQFEVFAKQNPRSPLAPTAWFNAAVNHERAGSNSAAVGAYSMVLKTQGPGTEKIRKKSKSLLARLYQESAQFEEAARLYREAAFENADDPLSANYLYNAGLMYEAIGRSGEAARIYGDYFNRAKKKSEKEDALFNIAEIYRRSKNSKMTIKAYKELLDFSPASKERTIQAHFWIYDSYRQLESAEVQRWARSTLDVSRTLKATAVGLGHFPARVKLHEAERTLEELKSVKIPGEPAAQKKAVDRKLDLLKTLNVHLNEVTRFDSPEEMVGGLSLLGQANEHMHAAIVRAPTPSGLNSKELEQYRAGVQDLAKPFSEKATQAHRATVDKASEFEVYNRAFETSRQYLAAQYPAEYYDRGEVFFESHFLNWIQ